MRTVAGVMDIDREPAGQVVTPPSVEPMGRSESLVEASVRRQTLIQALAGWRRLVTTQDTVAATMHTSQSAIARLERGGADPRLSTLERMAAAVGARIRFELEIDERAAGEATHLDAARVREAWMATVGGGVGEDGQLDRVRRDHEAVEELFREREAKECMAARLAAERRTPHDVARLTQALDSPARDSRGRVRRRGGARAVSQGGSRVPRSGGRGEQRARSHRGRSAPPRPGRERAGRVGPRLPAHGSAAAPRTDPGCDPPRRWRHRGPGDGGPFPPRLPTGLGDAHRRPQPQAGPRPGGAPVPP